MTFYPIGRNTKSNLFRSLILLLDLSREPIMLFDTRQNRILYATPRFCELSGYYLSELLKQSPEDILGGENITDYADATDVNLTLQSKNGNVLSVVGRWVPLGLPEPWAVVRISPSEDPSISMQRWWLQVLEAFGELPRLFRLPNLDRGVWEAANLLARLFEVGYVGVYRADSRFPALQRMAYVGNESLFPETLPTTDLIRLATSTVWIPGKRIITETHRIARMRNLSYVVSAPIGLEQAMVGLLVVADWEKSPPPFLLEVATMVAGYIDVLIQHFLLSESLHVEKAVYQHQEQIRSTIVENSHEGVVVLDTALLVEDLNTTAEMMFGYTRNEVIGHAVENILISPDRLMPALISASHGKSFPSLPGITLHRRNGQSFPADLKILPVERDGKVQAVVVLINDISENEQIRAQTRQLEQRAFLGEFMGVFAHEVLNPLNGISTGLQLLATRLGEDSPHRDLIARMEADCNRLAHQMEALKSLSKPYEPKQEPVNIGEVVSRLVERWRPRMARLKIMPIVQVDDNVPKVLGDWRALEQVFMNLISNAMDAMSQEGGVLSVRVKRNYSETLRPQVEITVTDNGPGIPEEIRDRIFQPFVTTKPHGTGLGLPITKRIITAHHGTIKVSSFPGGTVFHVYLPAIPEEEG
ncbi:ATP-binding protein [Thermanaerothrix sp. 4228-RoL]|uniref:histidine kinase n=1 Tax=Thermanaerothrix solaris TaxID=3058434 RepID=A0ABU3NJS8_9CHLR|nr:ATP-binding protein [Thermanaerothrix sp. 4228-RoL]MDT8897116.1 ATP-binding protein [Thermanaerothrix sp. 4228-RoL]